MPVNFQSLTIGDEYTRPQLAKLWGYSGYEALSRGVVTPKGMPFIILFITGEKQESFTQYRDTFEGGNLSIEGEKNHGNDERFISAEKAAEEIHLFYRSRHHAPFVYEGRIFLVWFERNSSTPSRFRFATESLQSKTQNDIATEESTHGFNEEGFSPDAEGRKILRTHITYERSARNRAQALLIHGTKCLACGFDFDEAYGAEYAHGYIEVHHKKSITKQEGTPVDPATDLTPLCSNCHSMSHRQRGRILNLDELKALINARKLAYSASSRNPQP